MAARKTKAQVAKTFAAAGVVQPQQKLTAEELQRHVRQRSVKFEDRRTRRNRSRSAQRRNAIQS